MDIINCILSDAELYDTYSPICYRQLLKNVPEPVAQRLLEDVFGIAAKEGFDQQGITLTLWMLRLTNRVLLKYIPHDEIKY